MPFFLLPLLLFLLPLPLLPFPFLPLCPCFVVAFILLFAVLVLSFIAIVLGSLQPLPQRFENRMVLTSAFNSEVNGFFSFGPADLPRQRALLPENAMFFRPPACWRRHYGPVKPLWQTRVSSESVPGGELLIFFQLGSLPLPLIIFIFTESGSGQSSSSNPFQSLAFRVSQLPASSVNSGFQVFLTVRCRRGSRQRLPVLSRLLKGWLLPFRHLCV